MKTYRKTYIEKVIECGTKNFDGKLIPADFDEKNLCTDCLDELLFNKNCVSNSSHTAYIGFVNDIISFSDITMMVVVEGNNNLHIHFLGMECITGKNLERLAEKVHEFFECVWN